jgi:hypothetical protein
MCLVSALWRAPKERKIVERCVYQIACPLALRAVEQEDVAHETFARVPNIQDADFNRKAENALLSLTDQHTQLSQELAASSQRNTARVDQALATIAALHGRLAQQLFASTARMTLTR